MIFKVGDMVVSLIGCECSNDCLKKGQKYQIEGIKSDEPYDSKIFLRGIRDSVSADSLAPLYTPKDLQRDCK